MRRLPHVAAPLPQPRPASETQPHDRRGQTAQLRAWLQVRAAGVVQHRARRLAAVNSRRGVAPSPRRLRLLSPLLTPAVVLLAIQLPQPLCQPRHLH